MPTVTICIPAYATGSAIIPTLRSALDQQYADLRVEVGVEPVDDETAAVCANFVSDSRLNICVNDEVLGWAGNIAAMLQRVDTSLFTVLAHDDQLHPTYVSRLVAALAGDRDAVVAYADMALFGHKSGTKQMSIDPADAATRLFSFFLAGAEAVPWRGVTRRAVLDSGTFPTNPFDSFAVECEWAAHLVSVGPVIRVGEPLYRKRTYGVGGSNVSGRWHAADLEWRGDAVEHHWARMRTIAAAAESRQAAIMAACDLAMMRRALGMLGAEAPKRLGFDHHLAQIDRALPKLAPDEGKRIAAAMREVRRARSPSTAVRLVRRSRRAAGRLSARFDHVPATRRPRRRRATDRRPIGAGRSWGRRR